jgi:hypothetical protein
MRRVRSLVKRDDVTVALWQSFEVEYIAGRESKQSAVDRVLATATADEVRFTEWNSGPSERLLMVEHFC